MSTARSKVEGKAKQSKALPPPGRPDCWTAAGATVRCSKDAVRVSFSLLVKPPSQSPPTHPRPPTDITPPVGGVTCC